MWKVIRYDQDEHDAGGGAGGVATSQDGAGDGIADAAAAALAGGTADGAGAGDGAAGPKAGTDGKTSQAAAGEQFEITWEGKKIQMTRDEVINNAQRAYNVTQREQELAKTRKDYQVKLLKLDQYYADLEKAGKPAKGADGAEPDADDPLSKVAGEVAELKNQLLVQSWEKSYAPVKQKYPDVSEKMLIEEFQVKIQAGEVDNSNEGLMQTAEAMAKGFDSTVETKLDKLLADPENPKIKAHNLKVIEAFVKGKKDLANAGGDKGAGGTGGKAKEAKSIDEVADSYLTR